MQRITSWAVLCAGMSMLLAGAGWAEPKSESAAAPKVEGAVAAHIAGTAITMAEVDAKALGTNMTLAQSLYEARLQALNQIIMERLLAKEAAAAGSTVDALLSQRLSEKAQPVTDAEVEAFYNARRDQWRGQTLEALSGRIRQFLAAQRMNTARESVLDELKQKSNVKMMLEPPRIQVVTAANDPVRGPTDADVTIVEYADFQ